MNELKSKCHDTFVELRLVPDNKTGDWKRDKDGCVVIQYYCAFCHKSCKIKEKEVDLNVQF